MILHLDLGAPIPPYEQVRTQITTMATTGVLPAGARLPPIRQLAADLGVATATIARAFRELERDGVILTRGRHGTFIRDALLPIRDDDRERQLTAAAQAFAIRARQLGVGADDAFRHLQRAFQTLVPRPRAPRDGPPAPVRQAASAPLE